MGRTWAGLDRPRTPPGGCVPVTTETTQTPTRLERLGRLPFTRLHRRLLTGSGAGWAMDAMDVGLISFVMAALKSEWQLTTEQVSWLGSIGFVGMALGASLGGLFADRIGRRNVFALTLLIYGIATGASALVGSLALLLIFRFVVGLGLGAELPVASTLVSEFAPPRIRGRLVVILEAFWAVGWLAAALIGYFVVAAGDSGWRWGLAIGAVPALWAVYVRRNLPESVHFLESRGRVDEAEAIVRQFEQSPPLRRSGEAGRGDSAEAVPVATAAPTTVPAVPAEPVEPAAAVPVSARQRLALLFSAEHRRRTIGLWGVWFLVNFAYYGAFIWLPTLLIDRGISISQSFGYTLIITAAQLPGYAVAAWLIEAWGRRATLVTFLGGSAVSAFLFALAAINAAPGTETLIVLSGCLLSFFALGAWGAVYAVGPEMYPTGIRGTGTGWAAGFGRIASIVAPLSVVWIQDAGGSWTTVFIVFAFAYLLSAGCALLLSERRGRILD
ncbi:MFS transporter [Pseudactinotalea sp. HY160]|uniref:MFS transporter n=1 Tax=Pseudactinotalea sp. HY160 TaxID=2654490 RepID=UPI00128E91EA|nr:MFS transporter [Pseudactinotalea sp. HY160]